MMPNRFACFFSISTARAGAAAFALSCLPAVSHAQQTIAVLDAIRTALPDAPRAQADAQAQDAKSDSQATASVNGTVLDGAGATLAGAAVMLTETSSGRTLVQKSGVDGTFSFPMVFAGSYSVRVQADGFEPFETAQFVLAPHAVYEVPRVSLVIARASTSVTVRPTEVIAAEQIKAEEKQRVFGIAPNFYTSFVYNAAPLTKKQKYSLATRATFDPARFVGAGIGAGIEQANNSYRGYGQGAAGYAKRYAALYGDGLFSDYLSHAVFPSVFHQDPRYFYQGTGTTRSRLEHALSFAVIARGDDGRSMPNYSDLFGDIGAGLISNLYYPHADRGIGLVFTNAALGIAGRAGNAVIREFVSKHITTNVAGSGKP